MQAKNARTRIISALIAATLSISWLSSCSQINISDDSQVTTPPSGSGTQPSTAALTDATDNVPAFTVTHADETKPSSPSPDTHPEPESTAVPGTDGGVNTNPPVSSHPISESTYETNENGEIIDDYTSDLVFDTEDPDELYKK